MGQEVGLSNLIEVVSLIGDPLSFGAQDLSISHSSGHGCVEQMQSNRFKHAQVQLLKTLVSLVH